jgi:hypothetical protein
MEGKNNLIKNNLENVDIQQEKGRQKNQKIKRCRVRVWGMFSRI